MSKDTAWSQHSLKQQTRFGLLYPNHKVQANLLLMTPMMCLVLCSYGFVVPMTLSTALQKYQTILGTAGAFYGLMYYTIISLLTWIMGLIHTGKLFTMPIYFFIVYSLDWTIYRPT